MKVKGKVLSEQLDKPINAELWEILIIKLKGIEPLDIILSLYFFFIFQFIKSKHSLSINPNKQPLSMILSCLVILELWKNI